MPPIPHRRRSVRNIKGLEGMPKLQALPIKDSMIKQYHERKLVMNIHKTGSAAALALGFLFGALLLLLAVVLPAQGFGPGALNSPATGIVFIASSGLPVLIDLIYLGNAVVFVLIVLALYERLRADAPAVMPVVVATGLVASALFLVYAMVNLTGNAGIVNFYDRDPIVGSAVYVALRMLGNAVNAGALFAAGLAILLSGWAALRARKLPAALCYLMLLAGFTTALSFAMLPLGLLGVLLAPVWSVWLGVSLWRGSNAVAV